MLIWQQKPTDIMNWFSSYGRNNECMNIVIKELYLRVKQDIKFIDNITCHWMVQHIWMLLSISFLVYI